MRHYTLTDQWYFSELNNHVKSVTDTSGLLQLIRPSKVLYIRNEGPNDAFLAFDQDTANAEDFRISPDDGLIEMRVQCEKIAMICLAGENALVRVNNNY